MKKGNKPTTEQLKVLTVIDGNEQIICEIHKIMPQSYTVQFKTEVMIISGWHVNNGIAKREHLLPAKTLKHLVFSLTSGAGVYEDDYNNIYIEQKDGSLLHIDKIEGRDFWASLSEKDIEEFERVWRMDVSVENYDLWHEAIK